MFGVYHSLLVRQLSKARDNDGSFQAVKLLSDISESYTDFDRVRQRMDRANRLMAEELEEMVSSLAQAAQDRAERIEELESAQTALAASEARARHLAYHDQLTGLPNRTLMGERLAQVQSVIRQTGKTYTVLMVDLDRFKQVNDTFGHQTGDQLLRKVASLFKKCCAKSDTIARLGGDEFAILRNGSNPGRVAKFAYNLIEEFSKPIQLDVGRVHIGCSIGIALIDNPKVDPLEALRRADLALYAAKTAGRGTFSFFEQSMDAAVRFQNELKEDLRVALHNGDIRLAYQPQVDEHGTLVGVEALARWTHPKRGDISPDLFIPIAEETGIIMQLGRYVLERAFRDAKSWEGLKVAVNVSAAQIRTKGFVAQVRSAIRETGIDPHNFELEITEGVLLGENQEILSTLNHLRKLGFSLALDDFGTGYSSLSYLRRFPVDKIKIDKSFVKGIAPGEEAEPIVEALISLANSLDLGVIAEGVETEEQHDVLREIGCKQVQGFLFGSPMAPKDIEKLIAQAGEAIGKTA